MPFRAILLDEAGVTSGAGAALFNDRRAFEAELARQGEPLPADLAAEGEAAARRRRTRRTRRPRRMAAQVG